MTPTLCVLLGSLPVVAGNDALEKKRELFSVPAHNQVHTVAFSPDGRRLAAGGANARLVVWDAATGKEVQTLAGHRSDIIDVTFSPDGKWLASSGREGAKVWDAATGKEVFTLQGKGWIARLAFSPDGRRLAAAGPQIITLWDVATGKETGLLKGHSSSLSSVAFSPDGKTLASAGVDRTIRLWDPTTSRELLILREHTSAVHTVAFSPDGKRLASASMDRSIKLWDTATGTALLTLTGHTNGVHGVAFSPDGRRLASSSADKTLKLWDLRTGQEVLTLLGHTGAVFAVAFSPDGRCLASTSADATVKLWALDVPQPQPVELSAEELQSLWRDLTGDHAAKSFQALLTLSAAPKHATPFLREQLRAAQRTRDQEQRLAQLLVDLDDARFPVRRRATAELEQMGRAVEPALRAMLEDRPSLEVRQRVELLLGRWSGARPSAEQVLAQRGTEVLERMGTPEAREILELLSRGAAPDWLMLEARLSLKRLKERPTE